MAIAFPNSRSIDGVLCLSTILRDGGLRVIAAPAALTEGSSRLYFDLKPKSAQDWIPPPHTADKTIGVKSKQHLVFLVRPKY